MNVTVLVLLISVNFAVAVLSAYVVLRSTRRYLKKTIKRIRRQRNQDLLGIAIPCWRRCGWKRPADTSSPAWSKRVRPQRPSNSMKTGRRRRRPVLYQKLWVSIPLNHPKNHTPCSVSRLGRTYFGH
jgi:hypothetical protein